MSLRPRPGAPSREEQARIERALVLAVLDAFLADCEEHGGDRGTLAVAREVRAGMALLDWDWELGRTGPLGDALRRLAAHRWERRDDEAPVWRWSEVLEAAAALCRLPATHQRTRQLAATATRAAQLGVVVVPDADG